MRLLSSSARPLLLLSAFALLLSGCGDSGSSDTAEDPYAAALSSGGSSSSASAASEDEEPDDGLGVEGLLGTMSEAAINRGMERGMDSIFRCFQRRYPEVEFLGGDIEFYFRVTLSGHVRYVYLRNSTLGDREAERCLVAAAQRFRFSQPEGGEAEFAAPLSLEAPEDVRPPVEWRASRVSSLVRSEGAVVLGDCSVAADSLSITAYVDRGGRVRAVGASIDDPEGAAALDCVAEHVMGWSMPDPGSYPAKVTFSLR